MEFFNFSPQKPDVSQLADRTKETFATSSGDILDTHRTYYNMYLKSVHNDHTKFEDSIYNVRTTNSTENPPRDYQAFEYVMVFLIFSYV
jgi:hypothetical protein